MGWVDESATGSVNSFLTRRGRAERRHRAEARSLERIQSALRPCVAGAFSVQGAPFSRYG
jgi:hypothetical protein